MQPLRDHLAKAIETQRLNDIGFTAAGCLGFCAAGPLTVVYPDRVWYPPTTTADIEEIVDPHLRQGVRVDRLVMILSRG